MAVQLPDIRSRIAIDTSDLQRASGAARSAAGAIQSGLGKAGGAADSFVARASKVGPTLQNVGKTATAFVSVPIVAAFGAAIKAASDLGESVNKTRVVFGSHARTVEDWSRTAARSFGLSRQEALEAASSFGTLFDAMGVGEAESARMSQRLVALAGDLASFNNIDPTEALDKLRSGLVGETEPLRQVGVLLNEAAVEAKGMQLGLAAAGEELTEQQKVTARYHIILDQTKTAQGDFARTADSLANRLRSGKAALTDVAATLGEHLLPAAARVLEVTGSLVRVVGSLPAPVTQAGLAFAGFLAAIGPVSFVAGALATNLARVVTVVQATTGYLGVLAATAGTAGVGIRGLGMAFATTFGPAIAIITGAVVAFNFLIDRLHDTENAQKDAAAQTQRLADLWPKVAESARGAGKDWAEATGQMREELRALDAEAARARLYNIAVRLVTEQGMPPSEAIKVVDRVAKDAFGPGYKININVADLDNAIQRVEALRESTRTVVSEIEGGWARLSASARRHLAEIGQRTGEAFQSGNIREQTRALTELVEATRVLQQARDEGRLSATEFSNAQDVLNETFLRATGIQDLTTSGFNSLRNSLEQLAAPQSEATAGQKAIAQAGLDAMAAGKGHTEVIQAMVAELQRQEGATAAATEKTQEQAKAMFDVSEETKKAVEAQKQYTDAVKAATDPFFAFAQAIQQRTDNQTKLNEAIAQHGPKSREARDASLELLQSQRDLDLAALSLAPHMGEVNRMLDDMVRRGVLTADQAKIMRGEIDRVQGSASGLVARSPYGIDVTADTRPAQNSMHHINSIMVAYLNERREFKIQADTRPAQAQVDHFVRTLGLRRDVILNIQAAIRADVQNIIPGARQHGGPVRRLRPYVVGERGPELFVPRIHGFIVNLRQAADAIARARTAGAALAGAGQIINMTLNLAGATIYDHDGFRAALDEAFSRLRRELRKRQ